MLNISETTALLQEHQKPYIITVDNDAKKDYEPILATYDYALTLEEVLLYLDDPFWQKLRRRLFCTFWLVFFALLSIALLLAYVQHAQQCPPTILSNVDSSTLATATSDLMSKLISAP